MTIQDFYNEFYLRAELSPAHARFCEQVYGQNLCQHGMADLPQLQLLVDLLEVQPYRYRGQRHTTVMVRRRICSCEELPVMVIRSPTAV